jgi:hypothetical protein
MSAELDGTQARIRELEGEVRDVKGRMQGLKKELYAKVKMGWGSESEGEDGLVICHACIQAV